MESNKKLQEAMSAMTESEARYVVDKGFNPVEIANFEKFKEFITAREKSIMSTGKVRVASDGRVLDLGCLKHVFKKKMEGLPELEQKKFHTLWDMYFRTLGTMNRAKQMAFKFGNERDPEAKAYRLLDHRKTELIELFGRFFSVTEVLDTVVNDWGMSCSRMTLNRFAQSYNDEIEEKGTGRVSAWGATKPLMPPAPAVEQHVLKHYPLNNIRPIEIRECGKGKAV